MYRKTFYLSFYLIFFLGAGQGSREGVRHPRAAPKKQELAVLLDDEEAQRVDREKNIKKSGEML